MIFSPVSSNSTNLKNRGSIGRVDRVDRSRIESNPNHTPNHTAQLFQIDWLIQKTPSNNTDQPNTEDPNQEKTPIQMKLIHTIRLSQRVRDRVMIRISSKPDQLERVRDHHKRMIEWIEEEIRAMLEAADQTPWSVEAVTWLQKLLHQEGEIDSHLQASLIRFKISWILSRTHPLPKTQSRAVLLVWVVTSLAWACVTHATIKEEEIQDTISLDRVAQGEVAAASNLQTQDTLTTLVTEEWITVDTISE